MERSQKKFVALERAFFVKVIDNLKIIVTSMTFLEVEKHIWVNEEIL